MPRSLIPQDAVSDRLREGRELLERARQARARSRVPVALNAFRVAHKAYEAAVSRARWVERDLRRQEARVAEAEVALRDARERLQAATADKGRERGLRGAAVAGARAAAKRLSAAKVPLRELRKVLRQATEQRSRQDLPWETTLAALRQATRTGRTADPLLRKALFGRQPA